MKKVTSLLTFVLIFNFIFISCNKDESPVEREELTEEEFDFSGLEVQDFIWQGLNFYYLWKDNVSNLNDSKIEDEQEYFNLLNPYTDPTDLFYDLCYNHPIKVGYDHPNLVDEWSWIVEDYNDLENQFAGISKSNGVEYRLHLETDSSTKVWGYVKYILPDSDAATKNIKRGDVFNSINGEQLTTSNYRDLLGLDTYTINLGNLNGGNPILNGENVELTQSEYYENPVYIAETLEVSGVKIGYLMYNSFTSNYDQQLNTAFAKLKSEGATELVLDLRYNGGGSVQTSVYLSSMITGQFNGQLFAKEQWNTLLQGYFEDNHPDWISNNFTDEIKKENEDGEITLQEDINSLNLNKVYIITTGSSASASELVINGLKPYIDVVTVGTTTSGKYTGSITMYDSDTFSKTGSNFNTSHTWAMQPIVLQTVNKSGENVKGGIIPTYETIEYIDEMQELGTVEEPLFAKAIELITGVVAKRDFRDKDLIEFEKIYDSKEAKRFGNEMYIDKKFPSDLKLR